MSNDKQMTYEELIKSIADFLEGSDGEYIAEVYNQICSEPIQYIGDSIWELQELQTRTPTTAEDGILDIDRAMIVNRRPDW